MRKHARLLVCPAFLLSVLTAAAQNDEPSAAASAATCGICGSFFLFFFLAILALNIAILVWVARDAKARGLDNGILWMLLVLFTGIVGLIVYLLARPQGNLMVCPNCGNKRLEAAVKCPSCGA
jgi:uncharacterized membrane protein YhaH (DUF805 family)